MENDTYLASSNTQKSAAIADDNTFHTNPPQSHSTTSKFRHYITRNIESPQKNKSVWTALHHVNLSFYFKSRSEMMRS